MDSLITRLNQQTDGLDTAGLAPSEHLPAVVRRGRRYLVAVSAATIVGATAAVAGAVVAVPQVVQELRGPQQPVVQPLSDEDQPRDRAEGAPSDEPSEQVPLEVPVVEETPDEVHDQGEPPAAADDDAAPADVTAPELVVRSPSDGAKVTSEKVTFTGEVEPGTSVHAGPFAATVGDDGSWSLMLIAQEGDNTVTFTATDDAGNTTTATVTVTYAPEKADDGSADDKSPDTSTDDPVTETQTFTASQELSELTAEPYTNRYWGTAQPGEKIKVISQYGWAYTWADAAGDWALEVTFEPPAGTNQFDVTARYYHDTSVAETFQLTTVAPEAAAFTATQQQSSVPASDPTNVYSGTGEPGHEVLVWTEKHGQATTTVAADGTWQVSLTYLDVAPGQTFKVKAADMDGTTRHWFEVSIT